MGGPVEPTAAVFMSALDGSIVLIALAAIFRGIHLDPLAPANVAYLLWLIMGYRLVQAVLVVTVGRLVTCSAESGSTTPALPCSRSRPCCCPSIHSRGGGGALWLIGWRLLQAVGGSMLVANSAAILTDAFPQRQRGFALGINQVAGLGGQFIGLVVGGLLASLDWRAVFWVNVPVGVFGTLWAYQRLRDSGQRGGGRIDWWGKLTFASGLGAILVAITEGIQPYGNHAMGWTNPSVLSLLLGGALLLAGFLMLERRVAEPLIQLSLFRIRASRPATRLRSPRPSPGAACGSCSSSGCRDLAAAARVRLQRRTALGWHLPAAADERLPRGRSPLWVSPTALGARGFATAGMLLDSTSFMGLMLLPVDFQYWPSRCSSPRTASAPACSARPTRRPS